MKKNPHIGSSLDDLFEEEEILISVHLLMTFLKKKGHLKKLT